MAESGASGPSAPRLTVFLDRDGVINRKPPEGGYVTRWVEFSFLPGAVQALAELRKAGARLIVVTNQRGVALGRMTQADLDAIHERMREELRAGGADVDAIYACPHEEGTCDCRKPRTGLFHQAMADEPAIDLAWAIMVGDSASDAAAARAIGIRFAAVGPNAADLDADVRGGSLLELVGRGAIR